MRVRVYRNLHRARWSVQVKKENGWRVAFHAETVLLCNCRAILSESGRDRARREGRRNVHAKIEGVLIANGIDLDCTRLPRVRYNPFEMEGFSQEVKGTCFFGRDAVFLVEEWRC